MRESEDPAQASSTTLMSSDGTLASRTSDYQQDTFMFKHVGKRFEKHLKKVGDGIHFHRLFNPRSPSVPVRERSEHEMEQIPADDFEDITRLIWSAFRVPFVTMLSRTVPVILSLIKVPAGCRD